MTLAERAALVESMCEAAKQAVRDTVEYFPGKPQPYWLDRFRVWEGLEVAQTSRHLAARISAAIDGICKEDVNNE